mgnify:FL=1|tara:strand:+ start:665 stop:1669 length:1005 start_codon:yes stop_codon:yes gene_type:complete
MLVFATETSCDETSICLMKDGEILKHIIFSQEIHKKHGGVVPELASRSHLEILQKIMSELVFKDNNYLQDIDAFAATCGPGLVGSLLVGSSFTKSLALGFKKPFYPINHLEGHILSTSFNNKINYPHLVLLLTGGHTQYYLLEDNNKIKLLGESVDDAVGEVFDKAAKLMGMSYPGGAEIEKNALLGDENFFKLPRPLINDETLNFSFSGIKTHINILIKKNHADEKFKKNLCASFQKTILDILIKKTEKAVNILSNKNLNIEQISIVGGVINNKYIRDNFENHFEKYKIKILYPLKEMMSDNAAMIAWACFKNLKKNNANINFKIDPRLKILD